MDDNVNRLIKKVFVIEILLLIVIYILFARGLLKNVLHSYILFIALLVALSAAIFIANYIEILFFIYHNIQIPKLSITVPKKVFNKRIIAANNLKGSSSKPFIYYIKDNAQLFIVMGVFGALVLYLSNISKSSEFTVFNNTTIVNQNLSNSNNTIFDYLFQVIGELFNFIVMLLNIQLISDFFLRISIKTSLCIFLLIAIMILYEALKYKTDKPSTNANFMIKIFFIIPFSLLILLFIPYLFSNVNFELSKYIILFTFANTLIYYIFRQIIRERNILI